MTSSHEALRDTGQRLGLAAPGNHKATNRMDLSIKWPSSGGLILRGFPNNAHQHSRSYLDLIPRFAAAY